MTRAHNASHIFPRLLLFSCMLQKCEVFVLLLCYLYYGNQHSQNTQVIRSCGNLYTYQTIFSHFDQTCGCYYVIRDVKISLHCSLNRSFIIFGYLYNNLCTTTENKTRLEIFCMLLFAASQYQIVG